MPDLEELARQANLAGPGVPLDPASPALARFAALVAEACAEIADDCDLASARIRAAFPMPKE